MTKRKLIALAVAALAGVFAFAGCAEEPLAATGGASSPAPQTSVAASASANASADSQPTISAAASGQSQESEETAASSTAAADTAADAVSAAADAAGVSDSVDMRFSTYSFLGRIVAIDREQDIFTIHEGTATSASTDGSGEVDAVEADDCLIVDVQTGREVDDDHLAVGNLVYATVSRQMTRSIPPQAQCYAIMTNLPEDGFGAAYYIRPSEVETLANGSLRILNQNGDLYITIPANLKIEAFDEDTSVSLSDIQVGSRLVVWYDMVAESYPAMTTAQRVMIDIDD